MPNTPATFLGYVYDPEIFDYTWQREPDTTLTALLNSGAIAPDSTIAGLVNSMSNRFTIPFYNTLKNIDPANFDGQTDVPIDEATSAYQTGVVWGRTQGWKAVDFQTVLTGDNVMTNIASQVGQAWNKYYQKNLIRLLSAIFDITGDSDWDNHKVDLASKSASMGDENLLSTTTINDVITQANGDNKGIYSAAIMHSRVAQRAENLQMLKFWIQTDTNGIQRPMGIANINGLTAIIDDGVPVKPSATVIGQSEYTTYLLGAGAIRFAMGSMTGSAPSAVERNEIKNGGEEVLITRTRRVYHPNGFNFNLDISNTGSPTDAQIGNSANWQRIFDAKALPFARLITNG